MSNMPANARLCHRCAEHYIGRTCPKCPPALPIAPPAAPAAPRAVDVPRLVLRLTGQVRGGKNAMGVTKSGRHYAKAPFKRWRAEMMSQINTQCGGVLISTPTNVRIDYVAGDRKRRDQTGIFDALFHLLEHAQIVTDDSLLWVVESSRSYSKESPGVTITFL